MKRLMFAALALSATLAVTAPADARQGCGPGFHRGPYGRCVVNRAGGYYRGQGYWNNGRYWRERYRWHNGWRYR